jgi:hypothetical protein
VCSSDLDLLVRPSRPTARIHCTYLCLRYPPQLMHRTSSPSTCRHCGKELDAHTRLTGGGHCRAASCLHREAQARTDRLKQALRVSVIADARAQLPHLRQQPNSVVWLQHCEPQLATVSADDREQHRSYLASVVAERMVIDRSRLAEPSADDSHPQSARLCAQCRGRCCVHGAAWHAFIDLTLLQQWQDEHPGSSLAEAVEAYVALLPEQHVAGACLYQTATGCALPRKHRAFICNGFACEPLRQLQRLAGQDAQVAVVALTFHHNVVERAAVIDDESVSAFQVELPSSLP